MLEVRNVVKTFGNMRAVDDISFSVDKGQVYGLLGPNGAGKTTILRMIMKILHPDSGEITVNGDSIDYEIKRRIGYLPEERGLYQKFKLGETVRYFAQLKGLSPASASKNTNYWFDRFGIADRTGSKIEELSKGNQQKVQFIISIIHQPELIILDEPFSGLDPVNQLLLKEIITEMSDSGTTVLFSTHQMEQVEKLCNSICLINDGKTILVGELKRIKREHGKDIIKFSFEGDGDIPEFDCFSLIVKEGSYYRGELTDGHGHKTALEILSDHGQLKHFEAVEPTLEQIFIDRIGGVV